VSKLPMIAYIYHGPGWKDPHLHPLEHKTMRDFTRANPTFYVRPVSDDPESWKRYAAGSIGEGANLETIAIGLLHKTGGLWLDSGVLPSDKIGVKTSPWNNEHGFFATRRSDGERGPSLKMMAALEGSSLAKAWFETTGFPAELDGPHVQYSPSEYFADCKGTDYANQICVANGANYTDSTGVDMAMYSNWMQDRRWDVPKYPDHGRLFFMHIPKTGGTAIEDAAQRVGFAWGRFDRHYDGIKGERQGSGNNLCGSPWHEPFHFGRRPGKVQTFCSIREPIDHLLSEFNFRATPPTCNHDYLQKWVKTKLTRDLMRTRFTDDCHLLSSADYASTCDYKIPYDHTHEGLALLMRVRFNISFWMSTKLGGLTHQVHPMWALRCHAKPHNLTTESLELINEYFKDDFDVYKQAQKEWGPLIAQGLVSPQIPDMCPSGEECTAADTNCPHSGCKVPWLDEKVAQDWPCIKVGCDPRKHTRWTPP